MKLQINEAGALTVRVEQEYSETSRHTGEPLRRLTVSAHGRFSAHEHEAILAALEGGEVFSLASDGNPDTRWRPRLMQWRSSDAETSYQFELLEDEGDLMPEMLDLSGVPVKPYQYSEDPGRGEADITIRCRVRTSPDETEQLFALMSETERYFPVTRQGVSDEPRTMRFGLCRWSRHEEEGYDKHSLVLVEEAPDEPRDSPPLVVPDWKVRHYTAFHQRLFHLLFERLEEKQVLSEGEADELMRLAEQERSRVMREFDRVEDIDAWDED